MQYVSHFVCVLIPMCTLCQSIVKINKCEIKLKYFWSSDRVNIFSQKNESQHNGVQSLRISYLYASSPMSREDHAWQITHVCYMSSCLSWYDLPQCKKLSLAFVYENNGGIPYLICSQLLVWMKTYMRRWSRLDSSSTKAAHIGGKIEMWHSRGLRPSIRIYPNF